MAEVEYKVRKATAVPTTPTTPNTLFCVAPTANADALELYMSSKDGNGLRRIPTTADIDAKIATAVAAIDKFTSVNTIAERDALDKTQYKRVFVKNASADVTVNSGSASYVYDEANNAWIKTSESESMDVIVRWADLDGKPTSSASAIDSAVSNSHTHANITQLNDIGDSNGSLTYKGKLVATTINDAW